MVWQGKDAVKQGRAMLGETDPLNSKPGSIRGDFCIGEQHPHSLWQELIPKVNILSFCTVECSPNPGTG